MISTIRRRYSSYHYVLVGADFHSEGGAWRSIHAFYKHLEGLGKPTLLVDLRRGDGWKQWVSALLFSPQIVINGMAALEHWRILLGLAMRSDAAVYLHDTDYMLDALERDKPWVYRCLARLLRDRLVLCVSEQMAAIYRERFGSLNLKVVYEVTEMEPEPVLSGNQLQVVMVGSLNRRKGYPLFVQTAELAAERGLPWQFHWVGGLGEADLAPVSSRIHWWGWRHSAAPIVKQSDAFFLASVDDPQPLACLEALALGKRAVVYAGTGSAEVVEGQQGCRVFSEYTPEAALAALVSALQEEVDCEALKTKLHAQCSVEAFGVHLNAAFADIPTPAIR